MLHLVYKITNTVNSMYYIGIHSTENVEDGYMGSGILIRKAIIEFGVSKFDREILYAFNSRKEAIQKEKEYVNRELLCDPLCYNLVCGGGSFETVSSKRELFSKHAKKVKHKAFIKLNNEIKYVFTVNEENLHKWSNWIDQVEKAVEDTSQKIMVIITKEGIKSWGLLVDRITELYNNQITHKTAVKMLSTMQRKNILDCLFVEETAWETV